MEGIKVMDANKVKAILKEKNQKKSDALIKIGLEYYEKVRKGEKSFEETKELIESLKEMDKIIYSCNIRLEELSNKEVKKCSCGHVITPEDKFCGGCGAGVNIEKYQDTEKTKCGSCSEEIKVSSVFCHCCGYKQQ